MDRRCEDQRHQDIIADFEAANIGSEKDLERVLDSIDGAPLVLMLDGFRTPTIWAPACGRLRPPGWTW